MPLPLATPLRRAALAGAALVVAAAALAPRATAAQELRLVGTIGSRAMLSIDGGPPRTLAIGQRHGDAELRQVQGNTATFSVQGRELTLTVGQPSGGTPLPVRRLQLRADANGHYVSDGQINGQPVRFLIDTGASTIAMDAQTAERLGLDYTQGQPVRVSTANGQTQGWSVRLDTVQLGGLSQRGVPATVTQQPMPYVLLGNSFLNHYQMTRSATVMVLQMQ